jgi:hypothetical protein
MMIFSFEIKIGKRSTRFLLEVMSRFDNFWMFLSVLKFKNIKEKSMKNGNNMLNSIVKLCGLACYRFVQMKTVKNYLKNRKSGYDFLSFFFF